MTITDNKSEVTLNQSSESRDSPALFSPEDQLHLHQLIQAQIWDQLTHAADNRQSEVVSLGRGADLIPKRWSLTGGIALHDWQLRCVDAWFENGKRGVVKVVTGAGKTMLALAIAERLQQENNHLTIAVVVPTLVLLQQWRFVLMRQGNLPSNAIGLLGGGHNDSFQNGVRILVCVLNSASKKLPAIVQNTCVGDDLLLIVDECHRAGATQMKHVFQTQRKYELGLSATPERNDSPEGEDSIGSDADEESLSVSFEETAVGRELGGVIFELNYAEAIRGGILPPFKVVHYGLSLLPKEREKYERLSREIKDLRSDLETPKRRGLALIRWCRSKAAAGNPKAARLIGLTSERKRLLYRIEERSAAVLRILLDAFQEDVDTRAILFHESIAEVMSLFALLRARGFDVVAEHSKFPDYVRAESLRLFSSGEAKVIVSAKSLIEGFDVPAADVGIVVAASSSVRQRVQTLGRLLRKGKRGSGEKEASLYVLYANQTVDELIYQKANWDEFIGASRNEYFTWANVATTPPAHREGPPRTPSPGERAIDASNLTPGDFYPGDVDEGKIFSLDTQGNISDDNGRYVRPNGELRKILQNSRKKGGRFRITSINRFVIELNKTREGWKGIYLGQLSKPVELAESTSANDPQNRSYAPGDSYPLPGVQGKTFSILQRDKRLIAIKGDNRVRFVEEPLEADKQVALREIKLQINRAHSRGHRISKLTVTPQGHVVYVYNGEAHFLGNAPEGSDGFKFED